MKLQSTTKPPYFPEPEQTTILRLGLHPLAMADWLIADEDFPQFLAHKKEVAVWQLSKVYQALPSSLAAQEEFARFLLAHLANNRKQYRLQGEELVHIESGTQWTTASPDLWQCSQWIQEDICLLEEHEGAYVMTAASLCSPSNWKLEEKIGKTVEHIHDPVPGYQQQLAERVHRLLKGISQAKPLFRYNWSLQTSSELCWREDREQDADGLYWRVERQTLLRLPETKAVVFGIRLFIHSLETMNKHAEFQQPLQAILNRLPEDMRQYKGLDKLLNDFRASEGKE